MVPSRSYLKFVGGNTTIAESHDPIIIEKGESALGPTDGSESRIAIQGHPDEGSKCCDRIHIVYDDFNQNHDNLTKDIRSLIMLHHLPIKMDKGMLHINL